MSDIRKFQQIRDQQRQWELYNFGPPNAKHSTLGLIEELGELAHALLKKSQGIRGTAAQHDAAITDALGDIGLYYISLLNATNTDTPTGGFILTCDQKADTLGGHISAILGRIAFLSKCNFEARDQYDRETIGDMLRHLNGLSNHLTKTPIFTHMELTWETIVRKRDWKRNPSTGVNPIVINGKNPIDPES